MGATTHPARRPSAGAVAGRWGACWAVRTPPAAANHRLASVSALQHEAQDPEHIVVAGGGVVAGDGGHQVGPPGPARREVEAAALAQPGTAIVARDATVGLVEDDGTALDREGRSAFRGGPSVEDAAALAVAAIAAQAAGATGGRVLHDRRAEE